MQRANKLTSAPPPPPPPPARPPLRQPTPDFPSVPRARVKGPKHLAARPKRRFARIVLGLVVVASLALGSAFLLLDPGSGAPQALAAGQDTDAPLVACGANPPGPRQRSATTSPKPHLAKNTDYRAVIYTSCGDMRIDLLEKEAPKTVANFVYLARSGFYNGLKWHEIVPDALIQTGDPNGFNGVSPDGPGYTIPDEGDPASRTYTYGTVGMANTGVENSAGSQFFIVTHDLKSALAGKPRPLQLDPNYTVFAQVEEEFFGSVNNIATQPLLGGTDQVTRAHPKLPVFVESIKIIEQRRS